MNTSSEGPRVGSSQDVWIQLVDDIIKKKEWRSRVWNQVGLA